MGCNFEYLHTGPISVRSSYAQELVVPSVATIWKFETATWFRNTHQIVFKTMKDVAATENKDAMRGRDMEANQSFIIKKKAIWAA